MNAPRISSYLALIFGVAGLAFSAFFVRWSGAPGLVSSFYRMVVAVVLLAWPFYRRARAAGGLPRREALIALLGGAFLAADVGLWASGVMLSGAVNPTLLANTAPLWVGLGALFLFRERLGTMFWVGLLLAMGGATLVLGLDSLRSASLGLGTLLGLLAGVFYGGYYLLTEVGRRTLDVLSYFWLAALGSTVTLLVMVLLLGQPLTGYPPASYLCFLAQGVVTQVIGYLAINYALGQLPASIVSPTMLGQPAFTALLAGPLLGEWLSPWQVVGGVVVLLGVWLVHRSRRG